MYESRYLVVNADCIANAFYDAVIVNAVVFGCGENIIGSCQLFLMFKLLLADI